MFYTGKKNVFQQFLYIFKKSFELMIHGLWNRFNFPFLVHMDIWLTTYVPHMHKRGHFIDHISTSSCPRNFWTTPIVLMKLPKLSLRQLIYIKVFVSHCGNIHFYVACIYEIQLVWHLCFSAVKPGRNTDPKCSLIW